ncbi:MAG: hypothetical protein WC299_06250, partial [Kiritimatiellia bacterium]
MNIEVYKVLVWDDDAVAWLSVIVDELARLRPKWKVRFENPDGIRDNVDVLKDAWSGHLAPRNPADATVEVVFDVYHSRAVENADLSVYAAAIVDNWLKKDYGGGQSELDDDHC